MRGNVKFFSPQKGFGFVTGPDGVDRHFGQRELPKGYVPQSGDEIDFSSGRGPKGPNATRVKLIKKAAPAAEPTTGKPAASAKAAPAQASEARKVEPSAPKGVGIDVLALDEYTEGDSLIVPVWVLVKEDGITVIGTKVEFSAKGAILIEPKPKLDTDGSGKVAFDVHLPKDALRANFLVKAMRKEIPARWQKGTGVVIETPTPTAPSNVDLQVTPAQAKEWMVFSISALAANKLVSSELAITVRSVNNSVLSMRQAGSLEWEHSKETVFACKGGRLTLQIRLANLAPGLNGDSVVFGIQGEAKEFSPFYVSGVLYPVPQAAPRSNNVETTQPTTTEKEPTVL